VPYLFPGDGLERRHSGRKEGELVMTMTDPIADMLTRIRNAAMLGRTEVTMPHSKLKEAIANVLKAEGYVSKITAKDGELTVELTETDKGDVKVEQLIRRSKPGRRMYLASGDLPKVREGLGIAIVSTSQGVMTASEAKKKKLGGEVMVEVY
jgi:small subunit ribosomal protein S8